MRSTTLVAVTLVLALLAVTDVAHADFLILTNGRSYGGEIKRFDDGSVTTGQAPFRYPPRLVARISTAKTADEVIEAWAKDIGDKTSAEDIEKAFAAFERKL